MRVQLLDSSITDKAYETVPCNMDGKRHESFLDIGDDYLCNSLIHFQSH